jgi:hypothetical protein
MVAQMAGPQFDVEEFDESLEVYQESPKDVVVQ